MHRERAQTSIVLRLNAGFFFEMLGIFLMLDCVLIFAFFTVSAGYAEHVAAGQAKAVSARGMPDAAFQEILRVQGITVEQPGEKKGTEVPEFFLDLYKDPSISGSRSLSLPEQSGLTFLQKIEGLSYRILFETKWGGPCAVSFHLGEQLFRFSPVLWIAMGAELFFLITRISRRARRIRRTLLPIAELAETARTLNTSGNFTPEEMQALAGKLDSINASRLDTRIAVDSTQVELQNLAAAINGMLDRINESYRAQVRFVSDASHELRTPIAVIQGYATLIDRWGKNDPKALQESITAIKGEADNMKLLVEQLLFLARGDNNTMILQMERFDLAELAGQVVKETKMIDAAHTFRASLEPAPVQADEALFKQAMRILVDNAVKYTPAGGSITVSTTKKEGQVWATVQDDGIGIPPEAVPQVFDRFFRTDESRARATGGAGLGLSIAKWIAQRHGGHMEVLSREKIGTRISIVLPAAKEIQKEPETETQ